MSLGEIVAHINLEIRLAIPVSELFRLFLQRHPNERQMIEGKLIISSSSIDYDFTIAISVWHHSVLTNSFRIFLSCQMLLVSNSFFSLPASQSLLCGRLVYEESSRSCWEHGPGPRRRCRYSTNSTVQHEQYSTARTVQHEQCSTARTVQYSTNSAVQHEQYSTARTVQYSTNSAVQHEQCSTARTVQYSTNSTVKYSTQ